MLLIGRERVGDAGRFQVQRRSPEAERREQPLDPLGARERRHPEPQPDPGRCPQAIRHGLAVQQPPVAGRSLEGVAKRVAEVQRDAPRLLALILADDLHLGPRRALNELCQGAGLERAACARGDALAVALEQGEQPFVTERRHLDCLGESRPTLALRERGEERHVDDDRHRLVERPDEVLALGQVDRRLASDRRIDLRDEDRRDVDERHAPQVDGGSEPSRVAERAAADGDDRLPPLDAQPRELARRRLDHG